MPAYAHLNRNSYYNQSDNFALWFVYVLKILFLKKVFQVLLGLQFLLLMLTILVFIHFESFKCLVWCASYFIFPQYYILNTSISCFVIIFIVNLVPSRMPVRLAVHFTLQHCYLFFSCPLHPDTCFFAAIEDLVSSWSQELVLHVLSGTGRTFPLSSSNSEHLLPMTFASRLLSSFLFIHFLCYHIALPVFISCISTAL